MVEVDNQQSSVEEQRLERKLEKVTCPICNCEVARAHMERHKKTKKHIKKRDELGMEELLPATPKKRENHPRPPKVKLESDDETMEYIKIDWTSQDILDKLYEIQRENIGLRYFYWNLWWHPGREECNIQEFIDKMIISEEMSNDLNAILTPIPILLKSYCKERSKAIFDYMEGLVNIHRQPLMYGACAKRQRPQGGREPKDWLPNCAFMLQIDAWLLTQFPRPKSTPTPKSKEEIERKQEEEARHEARYNTDWEYRLIFLTDCSSQFKGVTLPRLNASMNSKEVKKAMEYKVNVELMVRREMVLSYAKDILKDKELWKEITLLPLKIDEVTQLQNLLLWKAQNPNSKSATLAVESMIRFAKDKKMLIDMADFNMKCEKACMRGGWRNLIKQIIKTKRKSELPDLWSDLYKLSGDHQKPSSKLFDSIKDPIEI